MSLHPHVPHPRDLTVRTSGWNDRLLSWLAEHVLASTAMFDAALILPLLALPMSTAVKVTLGVVSGSWIQWWALPALQRSQVQADRKRDAKADADHAALSHIALTADQILTGVRAAQRSQVTVSVDAIDARIAEAVRRGMTGRDPGTRL